jgi:hypothetical protein
MQNLQTVLNLQTVPSLNITAENPGWMDDPDDLLLHFLREWIYTEPRPDLVCIGENEQQFPHDPNRVRRWKRGQQHVGAHCILPGYQPPVAPDDLQLRAVWAADYAPYANYPIAVLLADTLHPQCQGLLGAWGQFCAEEIGQDCSPVVHMNPAVIRRSIADWRRRLSTEAKPQSEAG